MKIISEHKPHYSPVASSVGKGYQSPKGEAEYDAAREERVTNDYSPSQSVRHKHIHRRQSAPKSRENFFFHSTKCLRREDISTPYW